MQEVMCLTQVLWNGHGTLCKRMWLVSSLTSSRHLRGFCNKAMASYKSSRTTAYSKDLRWRIVYQRKALEYSMLRVAENLGVSPATVSRTEELFDHSVKAGVSRRPQSRGEAHSEGFQWCGLALFGCHGAELPGCLSLVVGWEFIIRSGVSLFTGLDYWTGLLDWPFCH